MRQTNDVIYDSTRDLYISNNNALIIIDELNSGITTWSSLHTFQDKYFYRLSRGGSLSRDWSTELSNFRLVTSPRYCLLKSTFDSRFLAACNINVTRFNPTRQRPCTCLITATLNLKCRFLQYHLIFTRNKNNLQPQCWSMRWENYRYEFSWYKIEAVENALVPAALFFSFAID